MGVGRIHIPFKLGTIKDLKLTLFRPLPSTFLAEIMDKRTGIRDLKILTDPNALQCNFFIEFISGLFLSYIYGLFSD